MICVCNFCKIARYIHIISTGEQTPISNHPVISLGKAIVFKYLLSFMRHKEEFLSLIKKFVLDPCKGVVPCEVSPLTLNVFAFNIACF